MLLWNPGGNPRYLGSEDREFLELFAGQGEVTKALRQVAWLSLPPLCPNSPACCSNTRLVWGWPTWRCDWCGPSSSIWFDNTLGLCVSWWGRNCWNDIWFCRVTIAQKNKSSRFTEVLRFIWPVFLFKIFRGWTFMKLQTVVRLALNEVLRCQEGSLLLMAPCCKSFSIMSRVETYI